MVVALCLAAHSASVSGHPDLLLQIERLGVQIGNGQATADLYLQRGDLYRRHEDLQHAAADFASARRLDPSHPLLNFYEGWLYLDSGEPGPAEFHLARYLVTNPQHAKAWVLRGKADIQLALPARAAECFGQAIVHSERPSPELYRLQILATLATGEAGWEPAAQIAADAVERFGTEVIVLGLAADIALAMNRPQLAAGYLDGLPPALKTLPQWTVRYDLLHCLDNPPGVEGGECRAEAANTLHTRITMFMRSN